MHRPRHASLARAILRLSGTVFAAFALATAVRFGLIERDDLGPACAIATPFWPCDLRMLFIRGFLHGVYGQASLALGLLALLAGRRGSLSPGPGSPSAPAVAARLASLSAHGFAHAGLVVGTFGMVLYDFTWSGAGVIVSALALARLHGEWSKDGQPKQQAA